MADSSLPLPENLHSFLRFAVGIALESKRAEPFLAWMREHGARMLAEAVGDGDADPDGLCSLGTVMGREIWNHLPLPDNGYQPRKLPEPGRNDPCPCGSGRKFKQCCAQAMAGMPRLETDGLLPLVLDFVPKTELARLPAKRFAPELLAGIASEWEMAGKADRAAALLEPLFADPTGLDARHAAAFDVLMNAYLTLDRPRKRKELIELGLAARDPHLRGTALQRQCVTVFDGGEREEAWKLFQRALRESPDDPSLSLLEMTLLQAEAKPDQMRERARFWVARLLRRPDREDWADVIHTLQDVAADPASFGEAYVGDARPEFKRLAEVIADLPPVTGVAPLEVLDDGQGLWPENDAEWLEEWFNSDAELAENITWLRDHPQAWNEPEVLESLIHDAYDSGIPFDWLDRFLLGPLFERGRTLFDSALQMAPRVPERFEWGWMANRPIMGLLEERIHWLERNGRGQEAADACAELLRLNPNDNQGIRELYGAILLSLGCYGEVVTLCARYPDDLAALHYDLALALYALGRKGEALTVLNDAAQAFPKVLMTLVADHPREPRAEAFGVSVGGDYEAWLYRERHLALWQAAGALGWVGRFAASKRRK